MTIDQLRMEFEAREIESGAILTRCADGNYLDSAVQGRWEACRFGYGTRAGRITDLEAQVERMREALLDAALAVESKGK